MGIAENRTEDATIATGARTCIRPRCGTFTAAAEGICAFCRIEEMTVSPSRYCEDLGAGGVSTPCKLCGRAVGHWWISAEDSCGCRAVLCWPCTRDTPWVEKRRGPGTAALDRRADGTDALFVKLSQ